MENGDYSLMTLFLKALTYIICTMQQICIDRKYKLHVNRYSSHSTSCIDNTKVMCTEMEKVVTFMFGQIQNPITDFVFRIFPTFLTYFTLSK